MEGEQTNPPPPHGLTDGAQKIRALHGRTSGPTRRSTKGQWTPEEDEILQKAVQRFKGKNWKKIAECFKDRTDVQCLHRWQKVLNPELIKGPWSKEEDETIIKLVDKFGAKKWSNIAQHLPGRIGKQCRERWHNHLNPAINKEAWTRDEELTLIRAHQIYGNKWAELTKFLPGRTDNAIKNHWNSSVKKKLDSYLQSGLLTQFQPLPLVGNSNQAMISTSSGLQLSGDNNSPKGTEGEEVSECSQESANADQFPLSGETTNIVLHSRDDLRPNEDSDLGKEHNPSQACSSEPYYISLDDIATSFPEMAPPEACSSQFIEQKFSHEPGNSAIQYSQLVVHGLPNNSSLDLRQESSELQRDHIASNESHGMAIVPFQAPIGLAVSTSMDSVQTGQMLISDDECCRVLFTEAMNDGCFSSGDYNRGVDTVGLSGCTSFLCQSSYMQVSGTGGASASQTTCPMSSNNLIGASCSQSIPSVPSLLSSKDSTVVYNAQTNQLGAEDLQLVARANDSLIHAKESSGDYNRGVDIVDLSGCTSFLCQSSYMQISETGGTSASQTTCPMSSNNLIGASCSQPIPSVPSLLSSKDSRVIYNAQTNQLVAENLQLVTRADDSLIHARQSSNSPCVDGINNTEMQEPLVIEGDTSKLVTVNTSCGSDSKQTCQLMDEKPNVHKEQDTGTLCYEPPRFPSSDVPFFNCDLVQSGSEMQQEFSPLGIRQLMMSPMNCLTPFRLWDSPSRDSPESLLKSAAKTFMGTPSILKKRHRDLLTPLTDKRIDKKLEIDMTFTLTRDLSRLDVMFDDNVTREVDLVSPSSMQKCGEVSGGKQERKNQSSMLGDGKSETDIVDNSLDKVDQQTLDVDSNMKVDIAVTSEIVQPPSDVLVEHDMNDLILYSPNQVGFKLGKTIGSSARTPKSQSIFLKSFPGNPFSSIGSPSLLVKENTGDHTGNGAGFETFNIFGGTPFRRSLESPSAWKSPWFAFLPGPKIDTEITIEDIGIFMSPGDRSYDALGLMKEISEQTAAACANAQEVLTNETPKGLSKGATGKDMGKENIHPNAPRNHSQLASNVLLERRTLDFSECATPGKGLKSKSPAMSFSSPSSYLLKGCR